MAVDRLTMAAPATGWRPAAVPTLVVAGTAGLFALIAWHVGGSPSERTYPVWLDLVIAGAFVAAGLAARQTGQPGSMWWLLVVTGWAWLPQVLAPSQGSWPFTVALVGGLAWVGPLVTVLLVYPDGRLSGRIAVVAVVVGWFHATVLRLLAAMFTLRREGPDIPENHVKVAGVHPAFDWVDPLADTLPPVIALLTVTAVFLRWRSWGPAQRLRFGPALLLGGVVFAIELVITVRLRIGDGSVGEWPRVEQLAIAAVAGAFLAGYANNLLARFRAGGLAVQVRAHGGDLRRAVADTLRDPRAEVVALDQSAPLPEAPALTRVVPLLSGDRRVGALIVDDRISHDPVLFAATRELAALVLDRERLAAEVERRLAEVEASRARIVKAVDDERRRIERNLHDGAQQRFLGIALRLSRMRSQQTDPAIVDELSTAIDESRSALDELRTLARGLHPGVLVEAGLQAAIHDLASRATVPTRLTCSGLDGQPIPPAIEAAGYYVVSEALANVAKHAQASEATVGLRRSDDLLTVEVCDDGQGGAAITAGGGLLGLDDRVAAAGGTLAVTSPTGQGTSVTARFRLEVRRG